MSPVEQAYIILLVGGLIMIGFEMFLPDGVVGVFGALALIGAAITGFFVFPMVGAVLSAFMILIISLVSLFVWAWVVPKTPVGRALTLKEDLATAKAADSQLADLVGRSGVTLTPLRPAGLARIDGRRMDVVADGMAIERDVAIQVIDVHGNRVLVRPAVKPPA